MKDFSINIKILVDKAIQEVQKVEKVVGEVIKKTGEPITFTIDLNGAVAQADETAGKIVESFASANQEVAESTQKTTQNMIESYTRAGVSVMALIAMFKQIGNSLNSFISASNSAEKTTNALVSALRAKGEATQSNIRTYNEFANTMSNLTTINNSYILGLLSIATNYGILASRREEAVQGAIGLAKAFEGAGLSHEAALKGIALAYEGEWSQLQRYIPALRSAQSEVEKMTILKKAMKDGFSMAQDEINTTVGAMNQLSNNIGNLHQHVGDMIKTALNPFIIILNNVTSFLNRSPALLKFLAAGIMGITGTVVVLTTATLKLKTAVDAVNASMKANPLLLKISLITTAVTALGAAVSHFLSESKKAKQEWDEIGDSVNKVSFLTTKINEFAKRVDKLQEERMEFLTEHYKAEVSYQQKRLDLGLGSYEQLRAAADRYYKHVEDWHGKESDEWLEAYEIRKKAHENEFAIMDKEIEAIRKKFATQAEIAQQTHDDQMRQLRTFLSAGRITRAEFDDLELKSKKQLSDEITAIDEKEWLEKFAYAEMRKDLGILTYKELKTITEQYYEWTKTAYKKDSKEQLNAMNMVNLANERYIQEKKQKQEQLIKESSDLWANYVKLYESGFVPFDRLLEYYEQHRHALQMMELDLDDYLLKVKELDDQVTRLEKKRIDVKFEFDQKGLEMSDPVAAWREAQLKALDDYYVHRKEELIAAGLTEQQIAEQHAQAVSLIEEQHFQNRLKQVGAAFGSIAQATAQYGKTGFAISKAIQKAQVMIEIPASAMAAYRAMIGVPFVGPTLAPLAAAAAVATGAAQLKAIDNSQPPKFAGGGLLRGRSHVQGGVLIEAEGDEYITNKKRVKELGTGFFDFINFAPLQRVKDAFSNISLPPLMYMPIPTPAMAMGGNVSVVSSDINFTPVIDSINDLKEAVNDKSMTVNNFISANEVVNNTDPPLVNLIGNLGFSKKGSF